MDGFLYDVRLAIRGLLRAPLATCLAVSCLALGIGVNATMFSVISSLLIAPLPFRESDRLIQVLATQPEAGIRRGGTSYPDLVDFQERSRAFEGLAGVSSRSLTFADTTEPERVQGAAVSWRLFSTLGVVPALGRDFVATDDRIGAAPVVLLSDDLWRRRYNGDASIVGRAVTVNGRPHTVIGVMPPRVRFPFQQVAWTALAPTMAEAKRTDRSLEVFGRVASGFTLESARQELKSVAAGLSTSVLDDAGWSTTIEPLARYFVPQEVRLVTLTAMGAVTLVLLIACANVANLLLARATARAREMSVRAAIGAGRARIVRQLLTESVILGLVAAPVGIALAALGIRALLSAIPADDVPYLITFRLDPLTLLYTVSISGLTGLVFGLAPAAHAARGDLISTLREGGRTGEGGARNRARSALVVAEVAVSLVLLVGASLFVRSFMNLQRADTGFDTTAMTSARFFMSGDSYATPGAKARRVDDVVRRVQALPGVQAVAASNLIPLGGGGDVSRLEIAGRSFEKGKEPRLFFAGVTEHYFDALGTPALKGRLFTAQEAQAKTPVAVVNVSMARKFLAADVSSLPSLEPKRLAGAHELGALDPIGQRFRLSDDPAAEWLTVIGVVPDVMIEAVGDQEITPGAFVPYPYQETSNTGLIVRASGDATALTSAIREAIRASDPSLPMFSASSMDEVRRKGFWQFALFGQMFGMFGALALALAVIGVYGVLSYSVSQRTQEFGVRMALGAEPGVVRGMMIRQGMSLAARGIVLGVVGAFGVTRVIEGLLYNVTPTDPLAFGSVVLLMLVVAAAAAYLPARRATRVDPVVALRAE